jgi:geranylgeranyl reductase family protein
MRRIAIVGAGPAGCLAAHLLAEAGHRVRLFDGQGPWEKPCGGGLTARALHLDGAVGRDLPQQTIERISVYYGDRPAVTLTPSEPLVVVSRKQFGEHLLAGALSSGVAFVRSRVTGVRREGAVWDVRTRDASFDAEFLIGADGATSIVRRYVAQPLAGDDLSVTLGYFIRGRVSSHMKIFFVPGVDGYLWSFPRPDHVSWGLITRPGPHWTRRGKALLENYIVADLGPEAMDEAVFYSAHVPRLRRETWTTHSVRGDGWALLGDAAGLADPITGEGIYYALRSAHVLAGAFPDLDAYQEAIETECIRDLERGSKLYDLFYSGRFLGASFRKRMVQLARHSPTIRGHMARLIAGAQPYRGLRRKLLASAPRVAAEMLAAPFRRVAANNGRL